MSKNLAQKITYDGVVILVEGKDDLLLIEKLTNSNKPSIVEMHGYTNLKKQLQDIAISTKQFRDKITHLLIIVDADDNCVQRRQDILNQLNNFNIAMPSTYQLGTLECVNDIQIGIYILPDNSSTGCLETLLLKSVQHDGILQCAENMIECRQANDPGFNCSPNQRAKIKCRLHMNVLIVDYGFRYDKTFNSEINYSHPCFSQLKQFLSSCHPCECCHPRESGDPVLDSQSSWE